MSYFDKEKRKKALEDIKIIYECAREAKIDHALFMGFGGLLGFIREGRFIGHDNDVDMCILADKISREQEVKYYDLLKNKTMFVAREKSATINTEDGKRFGWFSLRRRHDRAKFCHWFFMPWKGYYWHTKGHKWINGRKFNRDVFKYDENYSAIMKGIPQHFTETLVSKKFYNVDINIPLRYGSCLDYWYDNWKIPKKGGSSIKRTVCVVKDWLDSSTWRTYFDA